MAATIPVNCPECKKQLNLPESLKGKKIRCKDCGTVFPVVEAAATAAKPAAGAAKPAAKPAAAKAAAKKSDDEDGPATYAFQNDEPPPQDGVKAAAPPPPKPKGAYDEPNPYGVTETDLTYRCPHCAKEMESEDAVICLHCGYNTQTRKKAEIRRIYDLTPQDKMMWLVPGFISVFLILFLAWLGWFFVWSGTMKSSWTVVDGWFDEATPPKTSALTKGVCLWFLSGCAYAIYRCGRTVVYRFIQQPVPPEEELN
jgi:hypothetical protein